MTDSLRCPIGKVEELAEEHKEDQRNDEEVKKGEGQLYTLMILP